MRMTQPRLTCLTELARYHYLSKTQMVRLGVSSDVSNLSQRVLKPLMENGMIRCNDLAKTHLFSLAKDGAEYIAEVLNLESVYYPPNRMQFIKDATHRMQTVDFAIALREHCIKEGKTLDFLHFYFLPKDAKPGPFCSINRLEIDSRIYTEADIHFRTTDRNGNQTLFVAEIHRQNRAARIVNQLDFHRLSLSRKVVQNHFGSESPPFVLSIYEEEPTMRTVMKRIQFDSDYKPFLSRFLFAMLDELIADFPGAWNSLENGMVTDPTHAEARRLLQRNDGR